MASTRYTGKFKRGRVVTYCYFTAAVSCQSCHKIKARGTITGTEKANGTTMYVIDKSTLVFEREITSRP